MPWPASRKDVVQVSSYWPLVAYWKLGQCLFQKTSKCEVKQNRLLVSVQYKYTLKYTTPVAQNSSSWIEIVDDSYWKSSCTVLSFKTSKTNPLLWWLETNSRYLWVKHKQKRNLGVKFYKSQVQGRRIRTKIIENYIHQWFDIRYWYQWHRDDSNKDAKAKKRKHWPSSFFHLTESLSPPSVDFTRSSGWLWEVFGGPQPLSTTNEFWVAALVTGFLLPASLSLLSILRMKCGAWAPWIPTKLWPRWGDPQM